MVNNHSSMSRNVDLTQSLSRTSGSDQGSNKLQHFLLQNAVNTTINNLTDEDQDQKILSEFTYLLDKSKTLFNGLRDLPQYGHGNNQWQAYYGRTFDVYTRLWKFQQQFRQILEHKMNLRRWQIGEIASKIGQLYYHYYLRTSESNYLFESYSFYQAIQTRNYYSKVNKEEKPDLMLKKLRFYARFIVVCLLLKKAKQVKDLAKELHRHIDEYCRVYDPPDQLEWQLVRNQINDFIQADTVVNVDSSVTLKTVLSNRLDLSEVPLFGETRKTQANSLSLQEILIIGNCQEQIKFSELSLDMFRMLQAVERQPTSALPDLDNDASRAMAMNDQLNDETSKSVIHRLNPHKYLLYKPSFSQFLTYSSASFKDLPAHGVLLIYLSSDGCETSAHTFGAESAAYDAGGLRTNNQRENVPSTSSLNLDGSCIGKQFKSDSFSKMTGSKDTHCIYPGDLYPLLRKPMFLIVDSQQSQAFQNIPKMFGQPFVGLFSPVSLPSAFEDTQDCNGKLFTLFLTTPLFGFCAICGVTDLCAEVFYKAQQLLRVIFTDIAKAFYRSKNIDQVFLQFGHDDFLRIFLIRYVFCYYAFRLHRAFKGADYYPCSQPLIAYEIIENVSIQRSVVNLAKCLDAENLFLLPEE